MALYPAVLQPIAGLKELEKSLKILREQFDVRTGGVILRGLSAGAKLIRDDAKNRVSGIRIPSGYMPAYFQKGRGKRTKTIVADNASAQALLRSNIVQHKIPADSRLAGGKLTVLVRVRNRGYTRVNGKIRFNRPGSSPGWWWWLEFGTSRHPATSFMRAAFEAQKFAALQEFRRHVRQEVEELFRKNLYSWQKAA